MKFLDDTRSPNIADSMQRMMICQNVVGKESQVNLQYTILSFICGDPFSLLSVIDYINVSIWFDISVRPRKGDALLFFSLHPDATTDDSSLHAGCPVIDGEKWSATKWIHVDSFDKIVGSQGNCTDENESCQRWAALGECTKNPEYMVGTAELPGYCRRSCNVC